MRSNQLSYLAAPLRRGKDKVRFDIRKCGSIFLHGVKVCFHGGAKRKEEATLVGAPPTLLFVCRVHAYFFAFRRACMALAFSTEALLLALMP